MCCNVFIYTRIYFYSLLGPPPGSVPSLLAPGPLPNVPMMMGRPFENVLSQLQQPSIQQPMMGPQVHQQQGLQVSTEHDMPEVYLCYTDLVAMNENGASQITGWHELIFIVWQNNR